MNYIKVLSAKPTGKIRWTTAKKPVRKDRWEAFKEKVKATFESQNLQTQTA